MNGPESNSVSKQVSNQISWSKKAPQEGEELVGLA